MKRIKTIDLTERKGENGGGKCRIVNRRHKPRNFKNQ